MTDSDTITLLTTIYFTVMGSLGFYLLWREWQWAQKEDDAREKRAFFAKAKGD